MIRKMMIGWLGAGLLLIGGSMGAAAQVSPTTGQPGAPANTCSTVSNPTVNTVTPGSAVGAKGSAFNPNGTAGTVYAGNTGTASLNANSTVAVSQYDAACVRLSGH
jgi:hypothetical protein